MNPSDLYAGFKRLGSGFSRSDSDLTPERLDAMFERIGHYDAEAWGLAVNVLLCGSHYPSFETILAAIDNAAEDLRRREVRKADEDAKRFLSGELPLYPERVSDHEYGRFRIKVILAIIGGASPSDAAAMLESQASRFDGYGLREEARRLRAMPSWNPSLEHPTWWERQQQAEKSIRTRQEIAAFRRVANNAPNESWTGWRKAGFNPEAPHA